MEVEGEKLRKESTESRQRLEESLHQQEQLRKSNEELHTWVRDRGSFDECHTIAGSLDQEEGHPLVRGIMEEIIPPHFIIPKVSPFTGEGDSEAHLKAF